MCMVSYSVSPLPEYLAYEQWDDIPEDVRDLGTGAGHLVITKSIDYDTCNDTQTFKHISPQTQNLHIDKSQTSQALNVSHTKHYLY